MLSAADGHDDGRQLVGQGREGILYGACDGNQNYGHICQQRFGRG